MKNGNTEKKILKKLSESLVANRSELIEVAKDNGNIDNAISSLVENELITPLYGSHTTFAITQKGIKEAK
ncbi:MAG: hypothetical protein J4428_04170 [Candidatus Aenigmarchaeota archaeon]|nr:hypothetical protein [Candidatus Aenigmarchaeota archaeon]